MERLLCHHEYGGQKRRSKGLLRAHLEGMTGFSRAQSTRLIGGYLKIGRVAPDLLCDFEDDFELNRHPKRKAGNAGYQPNRCSLGAKDISK